MNAFARFVFTFALVALPALPAFAADSGVRLEQSESALRVTWPISAEEDGVVVFSLDEAKPLMESLEIAAKGQPSTVVMKSLNPVRKGKGAWKRGSA